MLVEIPQVPQGALVTAVDGKRVFDCLLLSGRERKHILCISRRAAESAIERFGLGRGVAGEIRAHAHRFTEVGGLRNQLVSYVEVSWEGESKLREERRGRVHVVPYRKFSDSGFVQPTTLLAENDDDADVYLLLAKAIGPFPVLLSGCGGGGSTTAERLRRIAGEPRLVLCVVDSDRKWEGGRLGDTARAVESVYRELRESSAWVVVLPWRELENLLPRELVEAALGRPLDDRLFSGVDACLRYRQYGEMKDGVRGWCLKQVESDEGDGETVRTLKDASPSMGWKIPRKCKKCSCESREKCDRPVFEGVGGSALSRVAGVLRNPAMRRDVARWIRAHEPLAKVLREISAWGCAPAESVL